MNPILRAKIDNDMALNQRELAAATGYSAAMLRQMRLPMALGKMRLSAFWRFVEECTEAAEVGAVGG